MEQTAGIPIYPWFDQAPQNLKTRKQLAEAGLRPGGPARARVVWRRGGRWADLFDEAEAKPKRPPTQAQLAALAKADEKRRTCPVCKAVLPWVVTGYNVEHCPTCEARERATELEEVRRKAALWLSDPKTLILDTETTDLDGYLVSIAVISVAGEVLLDTLADPRHPISPEAQAVHGITQEQVAGAPTFAALSDQLTELLRGRRVVSYNAAFDSGILYREIERLALEGGGNLLDEAASRIWARGQAEAWTESIRWRCAMKLYAAWVGDWSDHHGDYRFQALPGGNHSALGDARATLRLLQRMAQEDDKE